MDSKVFVQSTKWSAITELLAKILTPLTNMILARLLTPEHFGLVATFTMVTTFAEVFTDAGFQKYLIQHDFSDKQELEKYTNVAFWSNLAFSVGVWVVIFAFCEQLASLVGSPGHGREITVLSLQIPLLAFSSIQTALFKRELKFKQLLPARVIAYLVPFLITVPLAVIYRNCWALVIGSLAKELASAIVLGIQSSWKPRFWFSITILIDMLGKSLWFMADSFMIWLTSYISTFIVGRALDSYYLGIYKVGTTTIAPYLTLLYTITAPVLFSGLSRIQNDELECRRIFLLYQRYASFFILPLGMLVFVFRDLATAILLGSNWGDATIIIGLSGLSGAFGSIIGQYNSDYYRAMGRPNVALGVQSAYVFAIFAALMWGVRQSFTTLAVVGGLIRFAYPVISGLAMSFFFKIRFRTVLRNILPGIMGVSVMALVALCLRDMLEGAFWWQIFACILSSLAYMIVLYFIPSSRQALNYIIKTKSTGV